ncbi:LysM peptidoglycan-binding domain-containing protein [Cryobacterium breve]|jgi:LysM repeat protein|uniref:LysM peptidoglycan-binding domain-containing protein n=1 Tax=Cryobacterium breve TaxID=1259258 RepID=A0ABY7NBB7_9MICO|nr:MULTISPECIES: LysM peptidoglycan-binding domain-containing protein [Cryobacterium]MDY7543310.1 LysM peptidoglycan-binding domain-containing protein [Cryobacterium sp. 5B3]MEB0000474.1 LysM peptidoglycan-binding domain-containing protein [Cryobacterium sp. RTS3]MEB0265108.1 LysM peptidoglycan-binding domain-containing protein [Cryobacterium sp. 10I5]MEB0276118.1 LysM peptidoglycan-binding domain-containing protein [Cryobacterium sp. 5B3]WBM79802.1 LysM peptidoglycan-binding domain-containing
MSTTIELVPGAHTRLRITRRGRAVLTAIAGVPLVVGALAIALNGGLAAADGSTLSGASGSATTFDYVTIQSGQSLWQLAKRIAPAADPREVIAEIVNLNQLPSESVQPGQRLALPAEY